MFGLFIGTLCLLALIATVRRRRFAYLAFGHRYGFAYGGPFASRWPGYGYGRGHGHGYGHGGGFRRGGHARRFVFEWLDTTPGQEKVIAQAAENVRSGMDGSFDELATARKELAIALGGDVLDESALRAALDRAIGVAQKLATELTQVLPSVHSALDGEQRKRLAELIAEGRRGFRARDWL
jgi:hypothetical protein